MLAKCDIRVEEVRLCVKSLPVMPKSSSLRCWAGSDLLHPPPALRYRNNNNNEKEPLRAVRSSGKGLMTQTLSGRSSSLQPRAAAAHSR